jgi:hypothetical protein
LSNSTCEVTARIGVQFVDVVHRDGGERLTSHFSAMAILSSIKVFLQLLCAFTAAATTASSCSTVRSGRVRTGFCVDGEMVV